MMAEAIGNAEKTAKQFAENSHSKINKIVEAGQGEFSIEEGDVPYKKIIRVVSTITYSLKDGLHRLIPFQQMKRPLPSPLSGGGSGLRYCSSLFCQVVFPPPYEEG